MSLCWVQRVGVVAWVSGRRRVLVAALVLGCVLAVALWPNAAVALTSANWAAGVEASLPANAAVGGEVDLLSVSCASAGNCGAVGQYVERSGRRQGLLLSESSGKWGAGAEASLPANAGPYPFAVLGSVSCPSAGDCAAVGDYSDGSGHRQGLLLSETAGTWGAGVEASLPADAGPDQLVRLSSVSCPSAGSCTAVGAYRDGSGYFHGLLLTETSGRWGTGIEASLPANAGPDPLALLSSVSCPSAGDCTAIGTYQDSSGHTQGLLLSETSGTWAAGIEASLPADAGPDPGVRLSSLSCGSAGNCGAVGNYRDGLGDFHGLVLSESSGTWVAGVEPSLPGNALQQARLSSVSCQSAGGCDAVGVYLLPGGPTPSAQNSAGLLLSESSGAWRAGLEASLPANAGPEPLAGLGSVSCPSAGNCGAIGSYTDREFSSHGLVLSESSGTWGAGVEASLPANAATYSYIQLNSVSCASADTCSAVGDYTDRSGKVQGLLLGAPLRPTISGATLGSKKFRARQGTALKLTLSQPAAIAVRITHTVKGHKVKDVCKPTAKKGRSCTTSVEVLIRQSVKGHEVKGICNSKAKKAKSCTKFVKKRIPTLSGVAGANSFELKLPGLKKGNFTAAITAKNANGRSNVVKLAFTITGD